MICAFNKCVFNTILCMSISIMLTNFNLLVWAQKVCKKFSSVGVHKNIFSFNPNKPWSVPHFWWGSERCLVCDEILKKSWMPSDEQASGQGNGLKASDWRSHSLRKTLGDLQERLVCVKDLILRTHKRALNQARKRDNTQQPQDIQREEQDERLLLGLHWKIRA